MEWIINQMKKLPIGIQDFKSLIEGDYVYVDKTQHIFRLLQNEVYFFARPRRFGKSLLISTFKSLFEGEKELFKGLWIYNQYDFQPHPVIHIDFTAIPFQSQGLEKGIENYLKKIANNHGISIVSDDYVSVFIELIEKLSENSKVVILIDEYDKPIIHNLTDVDYAIKQRDILKTLYQPLKSLGHRIRFLFISGVSKFSMVSIFSDLNHLKDISTADYSSDLLGLTESEIDSFFSDFLEEIQVKFNANRDEVLAQMRYWYNGYSFSHDMNKVYNPFSVLNFFDQKSYENYWFTTGTPTFIVEAIRDRTIDIVSTLPTEVSQDFFNKFDLQHIDKIDLFTLLYQTGYLTIKGYDPAYRSYTLDFPNNEVKESFLNNLVEVASYNTKHTISSSLLQIARGLDNNQWDVVVKQINIIFAGIPYHLYKSKQEYFYHALVHTILTLSGAEILSEVSTALGRIDAVIPSKNFIYVVEFKIGGETAANKAMEQIHSKKYYERFQNQEKPIVLVGISFDYDLKAISGFEVQEL